MKRKVAPVIILFLFMMSLGFTQEGQTGRIFGRVTDAQGALIPGVLVTLKSPKLVLAETTASTNENGDYRFLSLSPGVYEVTFSLEGLEKIVHKGIVVSAGNSTPLNVMMSLEALTESVTIRGQATNIDPLKTTVTVNMPVEFLRSIPSNRNINSYMEMVPGITGSTVHGSATTENTYNLDGVNVSSPSSGGKLVDYSMEIMEEISVKTSSLSAEYGNVKGAVVDVITKSGGNNLSGSLYFHLDHESFQSTNTEGTPLHNPDDTEKNGVKAIYEPGFTFGGPFIKNKLWFFANLNHINQSVYVPGFPYDKKVGEDDTPYEDSTWLPYAKLTFQLSKSDKFVLSYNNNTWSTDQFGASRYETLETTRTRESNVHVLNGQWTKNIGNNFLANLKAAYVKQSGIAYAKGNEASFTNSQTGETWGSHWRNTDGSESRRIQINADVSTFVDDFIGSHEIKAGGEMSLSRFNWKVWANIDPISGCSIVNMKPDSNGEIVYDWGFTVKGFDKITDTNILGLYFNDTWSINTNLALNLGVRYEDARIIIPVQGDPNEKPIDLGWTVVDRQVKEDRTVATWQTISPRVGLIYDIFSNGRTLFKTSWGRYAQPALTEFVNLTHPNGWIVSRTLLNPDGSVIADFPFMTPSASKVGYGDHELIAAHLDVFSVEIEQALWQDWSVGLKYIRKWDRNLLHKVDATRIDMDALLDRGELIWLGYEAIQTVDPYSGETVTFYNDTDPGRAPQEHLVNVPMGKRDYDGVEFNLNKAYAEGWSLDFSYVWASSRGLFPTSGNGPMGVTDMFINPNAHINSEGHFPQERRHQVKLKALVRGPWGINLGMYARYLSGLRYTRTISSDYLKLNLKPQPREIFAEPLGSQSYDGLFTVDLRLEKRFRFSDQVYFNLFADAFNIFNSNTVASVYSNSSNPDTEWEYLRVLGIQDPRLIRVGAKIEF